MTNREQLYQHATYCNKTY